MDPVQLFDPASSSYTYLLVDDSTGDAVIIDPVDEQLERDLELLSQRGLKLVWAIETHAHADHITSAGMLAEHAGARTAAPAGCGIGSAAVQLRDGDVLRFGAEQLTALHTPGHTGGSMSYRWRDHVFTGDTLLIDGCGRTDFQSGSARDLYHSLTAVLFALPEQTRVWPGHDYQGRSHSTVGVEKTSNARVAGKSLAEFEAVMHQLNLPRPKRIDQAVPANQRSGMRHDAGAQPGVAGEAPEIAASQQARPALGYAGDISPELAWQWWQAGEAVLVDVRSDAEREWVGFIPGAVPLAWRQWPGMVMNSAFDQGLLAAVQGKKAVLLCRSGVRSIAAARRAAQLGIEAYNILEGFEGDPNELAQRGRKGGWRLRGLPWRQG